MSSRVCVGGKGWRDIWLSHSADELTLAGRFWGRVPLRLREDPAGEVTGGGRCGGIPPHKGGRLRPTAPKRTLSTDNEGLLRGVDGR